MKEGGWNPYHSRGTRKSSLDCVEDQPSLINSVHLCLTVMNTILTVTRALRPNSSTHFLQIYCTGLIGLISHISWAWVAKRVLTIYIYIYIYRKTHCTYNVNLYCKHIKIGKCFRHLQSLYNFFLQMYIIFATFCVYKM